MIAALCVLGPALLLPARAAGDARAPRTQQAPGERLWQPRCARAPAGWQVRAVFVRERPCSRPWQALPRLWLAAAGTGRPYATGCQARAGGHRAGREPNRRPRRGAAAAAPRTIANSSLSPGATASRQRLVKSAAEDTQPLMPARGGPRSGLYPVLGRALEQSVPAAAHPHARAHAWRLRARDIAKAHKDGRVRGTDKPLASPQAPASRMLMTRGTLRSGACSTGRAPSSEGARRW